MQLTNNTAITSVCETKDGATETNPVVIIETYRDGTQWYRKYSDGVIEQGGYLTGLELNKEKSFDFVTPFTDATSVNVHLTNIFTGTNTNYRGGLAISSVSTINFVVYSDGFVTNATTGYWEARGI